MNKEFYISEKESDRFKLKIIRGTLDNLNLNKIRDYLISVKGDVLILRVNTSLSKASSIVNNIGFDCILAGTLITYGMDLRKYKIRTQNIIFPGIRRADRDDKDVLSFLINEIFTNYPNHYRSNKYFKESSVLDGYDEWATDTLLSNVGEVFIVEEKSKPVAFATTSVIGDVVKVELNGVLCGYRKKGIYSELFRYILSYYKRKLMKFLEISTQSSNLIVQHIWSREGLEVMKTQYTYHINSMLSTTVKPKYRVDRQISTPTVKNIENIARKILSDEYFKKKITIKLLREIVINKSSDLRTCVFIITTPYAAKKNYECVVKVMDVDDDLQLIFYFEVEEHEDPL